MANQVSTRVTALTKLAAQRKQMLKAAQVILPHAPVTMIAIAGPEPGHPGRLRSRRTPPGSPATSFVSTC